MSKISSDAKQQVKVIKNALDSMYDKIGSKKVFNEVQQEFEAIAGIVSMVDDWEEV